MVAEDDIVTALRQPPSGPTMVDVTLRLERFTELCKAVEDYIPEIPT
jgi:hypothetical protein